MSLWRPRLGDEEFDHAMMLAWFANAIMAGFDEANRRAQRALDAEREKVAKLEKIQAIDLKNNNEYREQLATLQTQLADRDAMILQMGKQAARLAKDGIAAKAQLRQVEGDAETYRKMHAVCTMNLALANNDLTTLRQLVEVHTKQLTELTIIPIGCSREQEFRWTQSIKDLRATMYTTSTTKGERMEHEELVRRIAKSGQEIKDSLSAKDLDLWHHATGCATEAGELLDAAKKVAIYNKPVDRENVIEELGDLEFYMQGIRANLDITREECLAHNIAKLTKRYPKGTFDNADAVARADKHGEQDH